jgi:hypothetical protein
LFRAIKGCCRWQIWYLLIRHYNGPVCGIWSVLYGNPTFAVTIFVVLVSKDPADNTGFT